MNMALKHWRIGLIIACLGTIGACGGLGNVQDSALNPPGTADPEAVSSMKNGNQAYVDGRWAEAREHYEHAIRVQPELAEAHYNLALTLDQLGNETDADEHYTQAANLAPGHSVIWNSRKFRRYGDVTIGKKGDSIPLLPGLGGLGGR